MACISKLKAFLCMFYALWLVVRIVESVPTKSMKKIVSCYMKQWIVIIISLIYKCEI